jgi:hypothetical protein
MAPVIKHRRPYVGDGPDGALRSAQIDRDELATLPTPGQPGYSTAIKERAGAIRSSIDRWEQQAADLTSTAGDSPVVHDAHLDTDDGTAPTKDAGFFEPGTAVDWTDQAGDRHSGIVETAFEGDRYEVVSGWDDNGYPLEVEAVEGHRLSFVPWNDPGPATVTKRADAGTVVRPQADGGVIDTGTCPSPRTWFDRNNVEPQLVERAAKHVYHALDPQAAADLAERSGGDLRFAMWLHLADGHRDCLPPSAPSLEGTDWRQLYKAGKSPYEATVNAWYQATFRGSDSAPAAALVAARKPG